ncbi:MAG: type II/IV secretion system ATPase subunit [archaeon]
MNQDTGFEFAHIEYSKKLSECTSGEIVAQKDNRMLLIKAPELTEKEHNFFSRALEEMKKSTKVIHTKGDVYFFLKEYCLENMILLNKEQREKILCLLEWESLGESILTPLLADTEFEEIVINGPKKPIIVYHQTFGWLTTNAEFTNEDKIRTIINKMAAPLGRQLSYHSPMLNAVLKDGSRLNASMNPIAFSGINATIRKFKENPLTPIDIIEFGTISEEATAFLWMSMQTSCSILICGNTGSGKTTTLNTLFCFLPKEERIISAEETPELLLPQNHIVKLNTAEQLNISLNSLIDNTFRMRPDRVIVGEIRNKEEAQAFVNTMLAGQARGSYATFHAESAEEALQRLKSFGIEEQTLASLDLIIVQKRLNKIDKTGARREERKITQICEIEKKKNKIIPKNLFLYEHETKTLNKVGESDRVLEKMTRTFSCNKRDIIQSMKKKEEILKKLKGKVTFKEFFELAERESE